MNELQSVTDIDEVIKYAERRAEGCHQMASSYHTDEGVYLPEETRFQYRAILWENIHEWLEELKELRKKKRPHGEWVKEWEEIPITGGIMHQPYWSCPRCGRKWEAYSAQFITFCSKCGMELIDGDCKEGDGNDKT